MKKKELYMAVEEHNLAIDAFARAMKEADVTYMAENHGHLTSNMKLAYIRFISACERLNSLYAKKES